MSAQNLSGMQFRQGTLWGESGAWLAADRQVRENMARRVTGAAGDPGFVEDMGRSNATRADMLALEHINPTVEPTRGLGGSYDRYDNIVEYGIGGDDADRRHTLYHELGHAIHIGGQRYGGTSYSSPHNPDPIQEGVADGVAHRMSKGGTGGVWTYRDSFEYSDQTLGRDWMDRARRGEKSVPADTILAGGPNWGSEGRAAYEASRALAASGQMPHSPHWTYSGGTVSQLTRTPGYTDRVKPEHQKALQAAVNRDQKDLGPNEQQKLF